MSMRPLIRSCMPGVAAALLASCTTIVVPDGAYEATYVGVVHLKHRSNHDDQSDFSKVTTVGIWFPDSTGAAGVGYSKRNMIRMDKNCQVVILIDNRLKIDDVLPLVESQAPGRGDICMEFTDLDH